MSRRLRLLVASAPLFAALAGPGCHRPTPPPPDTGPPEVVVSRPLYKKVTRYTEFTGQVQAPQTVQLRARVSGYIGKVDFRDGQEVKAGDVLFEIDPVIYAAQLKQAEGDVRDYTAQLKLYKADLARMTDLIQKGAASQTEYDQAVAKKDAAEAKQFTAGGQVEQAKQNLDWTKVTAPIAGRVDRAFLTPGNVATGGTTEGTVLTTIVSVDPMWAYFNVDEATVLYFQGMVRGGKIKETPQGKGLPIEVQLDGEKGYPHKGVLDFLSNQLDPKTGSLQIRATLPNPGPVRFFVPGLYVKGRVPVGEAAETPLIPDEAVVYDQGTPTVYTVGPGNRIAAKKITLGPPSDGLRVVADGLTPDDTVVIRGMIRVQPDAVVTPVPGEIKPAQPGK